MTTESALRYPDYGDSPPKIYIDNQVWTGTRSVAENNVPAPTTGAPALISYLENNDRQYPPASSTNPAIYSGSLLETNPAGQFPPDVQATRDMKFMAGISSNSPLRLQNSFVLFMEDRSVAFAALENIDPALFSGTSDPLLLQSSTVRQHSIAVPQANFTTNAIQKELWREHVLTAEFGSHVRDARNERFEDGMSSTFADRVNESIQTHGSAAVTAWGRVLSRYGNVYEAGEELLRQLGLLHHVPSHNVRLQLLVDNLNSSDPRIRDAAGLGLSFLDDPIALAPLREAYQAESAPWLRESFKLVIDRLETLA